MKVILMSKTSMNVEQYDTVTKIEKSGTNVVVTYGSGTTVTKAVADWNVYILSV